MFYVIQVFYGVLTYRLEKKLYAFHSDTTEKPRCNKRNLAFMFVFIGLFKALFQLHRLHRIMYCDRLIITDYLKRIQKEVVCGPY
jgi:hypothetical protein